MRRLLLRASLWASAGALVACTPIQTVNYPVREPDGRTVTVEKYYSSVTDDDPGDRSFKQIKAGHVDDALAAMKAESAKSPNDSSTHYNLAIIYEIKNDWPNALVEIKEANRLRAKDKLYMDEERFIERHVPKK